MDFLTSNKGPKLTSIIKSVFTFVLSTIFSLPAFSYTEISSLPWSLDLNDNGYVSDLVWATEGCSHVWESNAGWDGNGAAKFFPPTIYQGYCGLGWFVFGGGLSSGVNQLNARFLIYHGSTYTDYTGGNKVIIMERFDKSLDRPMIIPRFPNGDRSTYMTYGACAGILCTYQDGDDDPTDGVEYPFIGGDELQIGDPPFKREGQWISVELEAIASLGIINVYIHTRDGVISGLYQSRPMEQAGNMFDAIDIIGGYMGHGPSDPDNYFLLDDVVINNSYIGPPNGFLVAPPSPPTNLRID